jgi:hypothetical protein
MGSALRFPHELATWLHHLLVIPAKAGIQFHISWRAVISSWIPAFAGMTEKKLNDLQVAALDFRGETSGSVPTSLTYNRYSILSASEFTVSAS